MANLLIEIDSEAVRIVAGCDRKTAETFLSTPYIRIQIDEALRSRADDKIQELFSVFTEELNQEKIRLSTDLYQASESLTVAQALELSEKIMEAEAKGDYLTMQLLLNELNFRGEANV